MQTNRHIPERHDDLTEDLSWRQNVQGAAREWGVDVAQIKPCAARIRGVEQGWRDKAAYILATEWRRMGIPVAHAHRLASRWNRENLPPLYPSELAPRIESAYRGEKTYGCNGDLSHWCIGKPNCPYYARYVCGFNPPVKGRTTMIDFDALGWGTPHITPAQRLVYYGIIRLEAIRDVGPGGCVITSLRQLADLEQLSVSCVRESLRALDILRLIRYGPGRPRATSLPAKGCTIRRAVPIPDPPRPDGPTGRDLRRRLRSKTFNSQEGAAVEASADRPGSGGIPMKMSSTCAESALIVRGAHV